MTEALPRLSAVCYPRSRDLHGPIDVTLTSDIIRMFGTNFAPLRASHDLEKGRRIFTSAMDECRLI